MKTKLDNVGVFYEKAKYYYAVSVLYIARGFGRNNYEVDMSYYKYTRTIK